MGDFGIIDAGFLPLGDNRNEFILGGIVMRKSKIIILLLSVFVFLILVGCGSSDLLLDNTINPDEIDKIQFVQAMGNPVYGADSKIITERSEIAWFVHAFNGVVVGDEVRQENIGIGSHATIRFFSEDAIVYQFFFNVNDTGKLFLDSRFYYVEYPDLTPFELYLKSSAEVIVVDENFIEMERPSE